jgi:hypothetical protein
LKDSEHITADVEIQLSSIINSLNTPMHEIGDVGNNVVKPDTYHILKYDNYLAVFYCQKHRPHPIPSYIAERV